MACSSESMIFFALHQRTLPRFEMYDSRFAKANMCWSAGRILTKVLLRGEINRGELKRTDIRTLQAN